MHLLETADILLNTGASPAVVVDITVTLLFSRYAADEDSPSLSPAE